MQKRTVVLLLLFVFPLAVHLSDKSAAAHVDGWMSWLIDINFVDDQINAALTLTIEFEDSRLDPIVSVNSLECIDYGSLEISNEQANFSGDDYIVCEMPNLVDRVLTLTKDQLMISSQCVLEEIDPWASAQLTLNSENNQNEAFNPIFHHPNIQLYAPLVNSRQAALSYSLDNRMAQSESFDLVEDVELALWAEFTKAASNSYVPKFEVNGQDLTATPTVVPGPITFSNEATPIYVGYTSGSYLEGILTRLQVDPACRGYG